MEKSAEALLKLELERERRARKEAERLLEQKSLELFYRNEELRRSNQELEQFAYVASHDLQAPLRSITGFSRLLLKQAPAALGTEAREYLDFIDASAQHLHRLIADLLEYARVGRATPNPSWISAQSVVEQACAQLGSSLRDSGARVLHDGLPEIYGDGTQLVQLFQNLVGNAVKYCRKGVPPEVRINAACEAGGWQFAVADNGIGIAEEATSQIFTIFRRLHTQDQYEGTGIGLSICKKIVERHGGRIWVTSRPGEGSTFYFTLAGEPRPTAAKG